MFSDFCSQVVPACRVLVASDGMTRGMDFPSVSCIVNYDMPVHVRTYVHRAGRTARAGAAGQVVTLLRSEHIGAFTKMMKDGGNAGIKDFRVPNEVWQLVRDDVKAALRGVQGQLVEEGED